MTLMMLARMKSQLLRMLLAIVISTHASAGETPHLTPFFGVGIR
jgi:hypothetical protein